MIRLLRSRVVYPLLAGERFKGIHRRMAAIQRFEDLPPQQQLDQQWRKLKDMLQHAYDTVPYYRELMDTHGLPPAAIRNMEDYRRLPELTRESLRAHKQELISRKYQKSELRQANTGGTTSTPMQFYRDVPATAWKVALQWRLHAWSGYRLGDTALWMWGAKVDFSAQPSWKWSMLEKYGFGTRYLPIEGLDDATFARFVREMRRCRPQIVYGYSNLIDLFAQYVVQNRCDIPFPKAVICTAEQLSPSQRKNIRQVLQAPVHDHYGSRETGMLGADLDGKTGMRFHGSGCLVEFIPVQRTPEGWIARLVLTDLLNRAMPFLRHNTSDCVLIQDADLNAHTAFPRADKIHGRVQDNLVLSSGKLLPGISITGSLAEHARDMASIRSLQLVQENIGQMTLRYVAGGNEKTTTEELKSLETLLHAVIPDRFKLSFESMEEIPRSASGKYRLVLSKVSASDILATATKKPNTPNMVQV